MKAYFIGNRYDGCYYVRCYVPMCECGWDGSKTSLYNPTVSPEQMLKGALNADVVVFHRPDDEFKLKAIKLLKQAGKIVVFDNDDTYLPNSGTPTVMEKIDHQATLEKINKILKECAKESDFITVSTEHLAKEYEECGDVYVLKNCVCEEDWPEPKRNQSKKIRIGIVGSAASNNDYKQIIPLLDKLKDRDDVQLVLFALPPKDGKHTALEEVYKEEFSFWGKYNPEWQHFVPMSDYFDKLNDLELDIMLIPREDSYFNRCKSNLKFLEASMLEIPVIAQGFTDGKSPYDNDKEYLLLASNEQEWVDETLKLINSKDLRIKIGKKAKEYILKNYNIKDYAINYQELYNQYVYYKKNNNK